MGVTVINLKMPVSLCPGFHLEISEGNFMRHSILIIGVTMLSLSLVLGCGKPEEPQKAKKPEVKSQATPAKHDPASKGHGKKGTANLQIYNEPGMAIRTEYPDTMKAQSTGSGEGSGFIFRFKPRGNRLDQAEVHIFLPRGAATAAAQEPFVTGPRGLLESNGWKKTGETKDTREFPYDWVRKIISFSDPANQGMMGKILLGAASGQAVQVILYYPKDLGKEFLANAHVILKNLHFKSDKLPLGKSH
jgi:hypothetical protein